MAESPDSLGLVLQYQGPNPGLIMIVALNQSVVFCMSVLHLRKERERILV